MTISRKRFCAGLGASTVLLWLGSCGGGGDGGDGDNTLGGLITSGCGATQIAGNHQPPAGAHSLTIAAADLDSAVDKIYDIKGAADHNHQITLTPAQLKQIKAKTSVTVTSTLNGHTHAVTVNCVS
jgi:hypothetical protein